MLSSPKNKKELVDALRNEKDFAVLLLKTGKAIDLVMELRKMGSKQVNLIVIGPR